MTEKVNSVEKIDLGEKTQARCVFAHDLVFIIHLTGQGKLDRLDHQIMAIQSSEVGIGYKRIAKTLHRPTATIRYRISRLHTLLQPCLLTK